MREQVLPVAFAAIAVVCQIVISPVFTVFSVVPNFIASFVVVLVTMRRPGTTYVYEFVLGLIADLLAQTPVGLSSLLLLALSFVLSRVLEVVDRSSVAMSLIVYALASLVFELFFMIVLLIAGYSGGFVQLLIYRALPATVIDAALCALWYLVMRRFTFQRPANDAWRVTDNVRF